MSTYLPLQLLAALDLSKLQFILTLSDCFFLFLDFHRTLLH